MALSWENFQAPSIFSVTYRSTKPNSACLILEQVTPLSPKFLRISKNACGFIEVVLYKKWEPLVPTAYITI